MEISPNFVNFKDVETKEMMVSELIRTDVLVAEKGKAGNMQVGGERNKDKFTLR